MSLTCDHAVNMPIMIQLRNVPDDLHRRLKARAAMSGMSLSDFLIAEVARVAERPTPQEMLDRLHTRTPVEPRVAPVLAVRAARDAR